ncbi:uncharacterized protein LOC142109486 [Mixophyes fleayi]|uniref:uncharacterized protein LOC142109486 n=1 Tax=Mixophyes fleayi TaxID=3061075 RepID=UPI003F4D8F3D
MAGLTDMDTLNLETYNLSLITAKEDVLSDRTSTNWAVFTYEKKWSLKLLDSGVGRLEEFTKKCNKNQILYGLCRVSNSHTDLPRFVLIHWVGENVDPSRKEVSAQHLPAIRKFFKEASVVLSAQRIEDLSEEVVTQALSKVPQPARTFQKTRIPGSHELVGTNYMKTNPAIEMKFSRRDAFWQRSEREEERRKEMERKRIQEERIALERERVQREREEEEERERRIEEKEQLVNEQRRQQAQLEAEQRRMEKARWVQQQKEFEEEERGRYKRSQSIEMAAEAASLVSHRYMHPRNFFRQQEHSVSSSFSPPSTPSSPSKSPSGFFNRPTPRYQRSMTESILTPTSRSPTYIYGFQKRDSFSSPSPHTPKPCSPAFIFSKSPLPVTSTKVDSLPSFIPPPITTTRAGPSHIKGSSPTQTHYNTSPKAMSDDLPFRAEYITLSEPQQQPNSTPNPIPQTRPVSLNIIPQPNVQTQQSSVSSGIYKAELVPVDTISTLHSEATNKPIMKQTYGVKSPTSSPTSEEPTAIKATVSISTPVTEIAYASPTISPDLPKSEALVPISTTQAALPPSTPAVTVPISASQVSIPSAPAPDKDTFPLSSTANVTETKDGLVPPGRIDALSTTTTHIDLPTDESLVTPSDSTSVLVDRISPVSTPLASLLPYVVPRPYAPFNVETTDPSTLKTLPITVSLGYNALLPSSGFTGKLDEIPQIGNQNLKTLPQSLIYPSGSRFKSKTDSSPESQGEPHDNQTEVPLPEFIPVDVSLPTNAPPECEPNNNETEVPLPESLPVAVSLPTDASPECEPNNSQIEVPLPESLPVAVSLPTDASPECEPNNSQIEVPLPESLPVAVSLPTDVSPECEPNNSQIEVPLPESLPVDVSLPTDASPECEPNNSQIEVPLPESLPVAVSLPTDVSPECEPNNNETEVPLPESLPVAVSLPIDASTECEPNNSQIEVPLPEFLPVAVSLLTDVSTDCEPNNNQNEVPLPESLPVAVSPPIDSSPECEPNNNQNEVPLIEFLHISTSLSTDNPPQSLPNNTQIEVPLIDSLSVFDSLLTGDSPEYQPNNNQTEVQLIDPLPLFDSFPIDDSPQSLPNNNQTEMPLIEFLLVSTSLSTDDDDDDKQTEVPLIDYFPAFGSFPIDDSPHSLPNNNQTEVSLIDSLPAFDYFHTDNSLHSLPNNKQSEVPLNEFIPLSTSLSIDHSPESQPQNNQTEIPLLECVSLYDSFHIDDSQTNDSQTKVPLSQSLPLSSSLPTDRSPKSQSPPSDNLSLEAPPLNTVLTCDSLPTEKLILFEDPHPGSPPVTGNVISFEPLHTGGSTALDVKPMGIVAHSTDNVIVHNTLPTNNLVVENLPAEDFILYDSVPNPNDSSEDSNTKPSTQTQTLTTLQTVEHADHGDFNANSSQISL